MSLQVTAPRWLEMDNHSGNSTEISASEGGVPSTEQHIDITFDLGDNKLDLAQLDSKVRHGNETLALSHSASTSPVSSNFLSSRGRTAVWRQKVHSGVGAPVLAGHRILEFPSPSLATHIATIIVPGQGVLHETCRPESSSPLQDPVAYRSLPASGLMALSPNLSRASGIRLPSPGLSPVPANISLYTPGLPLTSAVQ
jgi:hypothetical protein